MMPSPESRPRIVFVVMSAISQASTIDQLAESLSPHTVLVHHDFSQTPDFHLSAPNVRFVPEPRRTGWAYFGFVDGIFHALQYALTHFEFDYLQLLSPTCLPIKSLAEFERYIAGPAEAHFDCIDLWKDADALMSVGYRALTPDKSLRHRLLRRLSLRYFGNSTARRDEAGIWLRSGCSKRPLDRLLGLSVLKAWLKARIGGHIFNADFHPYYGSTWFGARREVVQGLTDAFARPGMRDYFSRVHIAEEFLIPSLLMSLKPRKGPINHLVQTFEQAHPGVIDEQHMEKLRNSPAFFARKFPDNAAAAIRLRVLSDLAGLTSHVQLALVPPPSPAMVAESSPVLPQPKTETKSASVQVTRSPNADDSFLGSSFGHGTAA
ncbi:MAG: beta-1,6-N-acetylglucosaminyltransferase [Pseudomonadota bacterium]